MLRKIMLFAAAILLIASLTGCSCSGGAAAPTPTPSRAPTANMTPMAETSPDAAISPDAMISPDPSATPGSGDGGATGGPAGTSAGGTGTGVIENFQEGTEISVDDAPAVKKAVEEKYTNAEIKSVKHALADGQQVYEVQIVSGGSDKTLYVTSDGRITEKTA